jgi:hypothetical protein
MQRTEAAQKAHTLAIRVAAERAVRNAATRSKTPDWKRVHRAADAVTPKVEQHVRIAFKRALKSAVPGGQWARDQFGIEVQMNDALLALQKELHDGLQDLLIESLRAGGDAAAKNLTRALALRDASLVRGL